MSPLALPTGVEPARARAFKAARRHSARVRLARRACEAAVVLTLAGAGALWAWRNFGPALPGVGFDGVAFEGGRITMDKPRLTGTRPDGRSYAITAVKAMQDSQHPGNVDLALIGGEITTPDKETSRISAASGHYSAQTETLDLEGDVRLANPRYEIDLHSVHIAFKSGDYVSTEPVKVRLLPDTRIEAESFQALQSGAQVHFEGHVRTLIQARDAAVAGGTP